MSGPAIRTVLAVCLIAVVFLGAHAAKLRSAGYNYAVTADANYDFSRTRVRSLDAELRGGQVMIPARPPTADGVLMSVRLRSTLLGRWFDPSVQIDAGAETFTQTFERGGSGLRYLNLSNFPLGSMTPIRLRGHFVEISDQTVQIRYLASDVDAAHQTLLVLSPHPDDAEIAAFGLYAHHDAYVVTLTAGEAGEAGTFARFPGRAAFLEKGRTRAWNSRAVPMLGGLSPDHTANLGYFDGTLAAMHAHPEVAVTSLESAADTLAEFRQGRAPQLIPERPDGRATWVNLVRDLEYIVEHVKPDLIVTPYPLLDAHPDHQLTTIALIEALRDLGWNQGILLLYTNHSPGSSRYRGAATPGFRAGIRRSGIQPPQPRRAGSQVPRTRCDDRYPRGNRARITPGQRAIPDNGTAEKALRR
jgi:LmbE family N-acetylglucosaminyl deacetylase